MAGTNPSDHASDRLSAARGGSAYVESGRAILKLFIPGKPIGKGRPRVVSNGGRTWAFTPKTTENWESVIVFEAKTQAKKSGVPLPFEGRTVVELWFWKHKPKSYPKKVVWDTKKPDVDNLAKCVLDGLEKAGVIANDNIVTDLLLHKRYTDGQHPEEGVDVFIDGYL